MDFQNLNGVLKLERFFCLIKFYFQVEFFYYFDLRSTKHNLKEALLKCYDHVKHISI